MCNLRHHRDTRGNLPARKKLASCNAVADGMLKIIASGEREVPPPEREQIQPSLPL
jgi:hypothetical protein